MAELEIGILHSIELRDYEKLEALASEAISDMGWDGFLRILSLSQIRGMTIPDWNIPVRKGPLRDALVRLLGLELLIGLDCDYISSFNQIKSNDLTDVRNEVFPIIIDLLRKQVERRNTFFLDTDAFSTTPYAVFVKDIISARTAEIEELPSKPSLREVYGTYYGFTILTSGRTSSYRAGATEKGVKCIEDLATQFGKQTKLSARIFQPSRKAFANCTKETKELLWNILRMFNGGWDTRSNAVKKLGEIGDSRATDSVISNLQNTTNDYFKPALLKALGAIGDPKGFESALSCLNNSRLHRTAILSLGGIRHPNALERLIQIKKANNRGDMASVITALGTTRSKRALEILSSFLSSRNGRIVQKSVEALCSIGKAGLDELTKVPSKLAESLKRANKSHKLIRILKQIPNFQWTSELQKAIAQAISRSRSKANYIINEVNLVPELANSEIIIEGLLKRIERMLQYRWRQWEFRRLLRGSSVPRFLNNAIRTSKQSQKIVRIVSRCTELSTLPEIKSAIEYVERRDNPQKAPVIEQVHPIKHIVARRKQALKKPPTLQQSLATYIDDHSKLAVDSSIAQTEREKKKSRRDFFEDMYA